MAMNLRKSILRNVIVNIVVCLALSMALAVVSGSGNPGLGKLGWLFAMALGIGLFAGWRTIFKAKNGVLGSIPRDLSYVRLDRDAAIGGTTIDWRLLDDYAAQLEARGYASLGDYTVYPLPKQFVGVAACFVDGAATTLVEVQQIHMLQAVPGGAPHPEGVHFSIVSLLFGGVRVTTTDHTVRASNYLIRGDLDVTASYPGMGLLALLEKHERLLTKLGHRTGKQAVSGLNMERHVLLIRACFEQARRRIDASSGYGIARLVDRFESDPASNWAPSSASIAGLPDSGESPLAALDLSATSQLRPPILDTSVIAARTGHDGPIATGTTVAPAEDDGRHAELRQRIQGSANWFYWIAGLSLVNLVIAAAGSTWSFAIGLGISQVLSAIGASVHASQGAISLSVLLLFAASFGATVFFAACGRFAARPSVLAFILGITVFALDSLIFLLAADWIGVAFHALALFYLWAGLAAARKLGKLKAA